MKKVLLASTALVLSAGVAAADVAVSGDGRMGVANNFTGDLVFSSRIRIAFSASGETDGGLSFGGSIRADNAGGGEGGTAGSVFIEGAFGKLSMGDVDSAAEAAVGDVSGVGYQLAGRQESIYIGGPATAALYEYSAGDLSVYLGAGQQETGNDSVSVGLAYSFGNFGVSAGYETNDSVGAAPDTATNVDHIILGATAAFGDATLKVIHGMADFDGGDADQTAVSLDYVMGATTITAMYYDESEFGALGSGEGFGLGVAYDLGGGATLKAGYISDETDGATEDGFDLGINMSF
ncbi:porin [Alphaproteobacteria bacterium GH1-50]|uniref:Porin n=1 Tax=Kangsaoukella pontilimi TaxID=2691042 RepID=A0A7C9II44_9RHOB|nr:porin [Kangsaoukella pontilimi]MXQ09444.1 porin [Kangsaoukella pontilimi]